MRLCGGFEPWLVNRHEVIEYIRQKKLKARQIPELCTDSDLCSYVTSTIIGVEITDLSK